MPRSYDDTQPAEAPPVVERQPILADRSYSIILETFERRLRLGELRVGDKLPSERELAARHGISRPSVREGLRVLNALGLIRSSTGSGPKSGAIIISEPSDALSWALRMHIATRSLPVKDVVSTRLLLEGPAARAAAAAPDSPERAAALERARVHLAEMDEQISDERFHFCDTRFHYELSKLGGNIVLDTVIDSLHMATMSYVQEAVPFLRIGRRSSARCSSSITALLRRLPLMMSRQPMSGCASTLRGSIRCLIGLRRSGRGSIRRGIFCTRICATRMYTTKTFTPARLCPSTP